MQDDINTQTNPEWNNGTAWKSQESATSNREGLWPFCPYGCIPFMFKASLSQKSASLCLVKITAPLSLTNHSSSVSQKSTSVCLSVITAPLFLKELWPFCLSKFAAFLSPYDHSPTVNHCCPNIFIWMEQQLTSFLGQLDSFFYML